MIYYKDMSKGQVLLLHISQISGHRSANLAIENALRSLDPEMQTLSIDAFSYTNPLLERIVNRLYMVMLKYFPGLWERLYDHQGVLKRVEPARSCILSLNIRKIRRLIERFSPDIVVCTQAFPCNMVADYKKRYNRKLPLVGVLTDYAPHSYWISPYVDIFVVPAPVIAERFVQKGVPEQGVRVIGIPIDPKFKQKKEGLQILNRLGLLEQVDTILIMGGGQGLGPIKKMVFNLVRIKKPLQLIVVCGTNRPLFRWLNKNKGKFRQRVAVLGYTDQVHNLMATAKIIITKPGGVTVAEALSQALPIIIVNPLPGQETQNTRFLTESGVAVVVRQLDRLAETLEKLLSNSKLLEQMRQKALALKQEDSALKIARLLLELTAKQK